MYIYIYDILGALLAYRTWNKMHISRYVEYNLWILIILIININLNLYPKITHPNLPLRVNHGESFGSTFDKIERDMGEHSILPGQLVDLMPCHKVL